LERNQKEKIVAELTSRLDEVKVVFLTDFKGLDVTRISDLRRRVREVGGEYRVVKNTLLKQAAKGTAAEHLSDFLVGNNALGTTTGDPVPLAKALVDFAKENEELVIKRGIISGQILDFEEIKRIGNLPPQHVLLGILLGTMNAVPTKLVRLFNSIIGNFVYALAAIRDQKEQA